MASVKSAIRSWIKPIAFGLLGTKGYFWLQYFAKIRDIEKKLVEEPEMELLPRLVSKDSAALDIGANYAYYTVRLARLCPGGKVYAFEPIPLTFDVCKKIIDHYQLENVQLYQKGVGSKNETRSFEVPLQNMGMISAGQAHLKGRNNEMEGKEKYHPFEKHATFECQVVTVDSQLSNLTKLDFVKIDIEGAEFFALQGMKDTLNRFRPAVLIEVAPFFLKGFGIEQHQIANLIREIGYSIFRYNSSIKKLEPYSAPPFADSNYILLPQDNLGKFKDLIA